MFYNVLYIKTPYLYVARDEGVEFLGDFFLLFEKMADECWSMDDMNDKSCTLFPRLGTYNPCFYRGSIYGKCVCGVYEPFVFGQKKVSMGSVVH